MQPVRILVDGLFMFMVNMPVKGEAELQSNFKDFKKQIPSLPTDMQWEINHHTLIDYSRYFQY